MDFSYSVKKFISRFINNGPFDIESEYCVFDPTNPKETRFVPLRKIKGFPPSYIYLHRVTSETQDPNIRNFHMTLMDKYHRKLELDGRPIECEGIIGKTENWTSSDNHIEKVEFMLQRAADYMNKEREKFKEVKIEQIPSTADGYSFGY